MKIYAGILFSVFFAASVHCQNLLPNGDFKEEIVCFEYEQDCGPMGWKLTSSDPPSYYQEFNKGDTLPFNQWTAIVARSFIKEQYREYLQAPILCPLLKGHSYTFSMVVKPQNYAVQELGVALTHGYTVSDENTRVTIVPDLIFKNQHFLKDKKHDWFTLSASFRANGNEKYVLIGNFLTDKQTRLKKVSRKKLSKVIYFVQKVELVSDEHLPPCDFSEEIKALRKDRYRHTLFKKHFFPGPAADTLKTITSKKINKPAKTDSSMKIPEVKPVYFAFDQYTLSPEAKANLEEIKKLLYQNPAFGIAIYGHTDSTGTESYNRKLSTQRAESVWLYLKDSGIQISRMQYKGMSFHLPAKSNQTDEGRKANRRVEILIIRGKLDDKNR